MTFRRKAWPSQILINQLEKTVISFETLGIFVLWVRINVLNYVTGVCFRHCLPSAVMLQVAARCLAITRDFCRHIRTLHHASSYAKFSPTAGSVGDSKMWAERSLSCGNWYPHTHRTRNSRRTKSFAWPLGMSHLSEPVQGLPLFQKVEVDRIWNQYLTFNY